MPGTKRKTSQATDRDALDRWQDIIREYERVARSAKSGGDGAKARLGDIEAEIIATAKRSRAFARLHRVATRDLLAKRVRAVGSMLDVVLAHRHPKTRQLAARQPSDHRKLVKRPVPIGKVANAHRRLDAAFLKVILGSELVRAARLLRRRPHEICRVLLSNDVGPVLAAKGRVMASLKVLSQLGYGSVRTIQARWSDAKRGTE